MRALFCLSALSFTACYSPRFDECTVRCLGGCPSGLTCDPSDGFCHAPGTPSCAGPDGGPGAADAGPGLPDAARAADASPGSPDAAAGSPDAAAGSPDAGNPCIPTACGCPGDWTVSTVEMGGVSGRVAMAVDFDERPHLAYFKGDDLMSALALPGGDWFKETVASPGPSSRISLSIDSFEHSEIAFDDGSGTITDAYQVSAMWRLQPILVGAAPWLVDDDGEGYPHIAYTTSDGAAVLYWARINGIEEDATIGHGGLEPVLALESTTNADAEPHVVWRDATEDQLWYAEVNPFTDAWESHAFGAAGAHSLAVESPGIADIANLEGTTLRFRQWLGGSAPTVTDVNAQAAGDDVPIVLDAATTPFIGHYASGPEGFGFVVAHSTFGGWVTEPVATLTSPPPGSLRSALGVDPAGGIHAIFIGGAGDDLIYARRCP